MLLPPHIRVCCADEHPLIFERPSAQRKSTRGAMIVLTVVGWAVWVSLWRPALSLLPWLFGVNIMRHQWVELAGWTGLADFAIHTTPYGLALCAMLLIWASVNYFRFRGTDRRKERPRATAEDDAQWTRMTAEALDASYHLTNLICHHDDQGYLTKALSNPDKRYSRPSDGQRTTPESSPVGSPNWRAGPALGAAASAPRELEAAG